MSAPPRLQRYRPRFTATREGLPLGQGTEIQVLSLQGTRTDIAGEKNLLVTAIVEISAVVTIYGDMGCSICGFPIPEPQNQVNDDALWFILENHDHGRYVFPREEGCADERDSYPVENWKKTPSGLTCPTCSRELQDAIQAVKARLTGSRKP